MELVKRKITQNGNRWKMRAYLRIEGNETGEPEELWQEAFALAETAPSAFPENGLVMNYPYWRKVGERVMVYQSSFID